MLKTARPNGVRAASRASRLAMVWAAACLGLVACGDTDAQRVTNPAVESLPAFDAVSLAVPGELTLQRGEAPSISLSGDPEAVDNVIVEVRDDTLHLESEDDSWGLSWSTGEEKLRIEVTYTDLKTILVTGHGDANIDSWRRESAKVVIAGSGSAEVTNVDVDTMTLSISGSGDIEVSGQAAELDVAIAGSGDIEAFELASQRVSASISGSGDIEVAATAHLKARIAGSGDIRYVGDPDLDERVVGSGSVKRAAGSELAL